MKVALVHYWLVKMRGGEKVLEALCELYPEADVYTHVYAPENISATIRRHVVRETFIGRLPFARRAYQSYLPLMPIALEQLDLSGYDLVISSESGPAKGVVTGPRTLHVCYCHTPMRYVWDMYHEYRRSAGWLARLVMPPIMHRLRLWDLATASRVDHFFANSSFVAQRVLKHYRRSAEVIAPPVDTGSFTPGLPAEEFYLMAGELVAYKRPDLAVDAFNRLELPLVVIGDGPMLAKLRAQAGPNVRLLGWQDSAVLKSHFQRCRALIFPGEEDFGIVPVEAMASGRPVIAYGSGGVLDSVVPGVTGILFGEQTVDALCDAVRSFVASPEKFDADRIAAHARRFDRTIFAERIRGAIEQLLEQRRQMRA